MSYSLLVIYFKWHIFYGSLVGGIVPKEVEMPLDDGGVCYCLTISIFNVVCISASRFDKR